MKSMLRVAALIGFVAIAASVTACSDIRPATSAEVAAMQADKPGPR
jgi:hypothetical protein